MIKAKSGARAELYRGLVPLAEATAVAYHIITDKPAPLREPSRLAEVRGLVAIALSSVGTVLKQEGGSAVPLSAAEVNERLFVRGANPDLEGLCMRRGELLRAVELLEEAHGAFGHGDRLEALRKLG